ncbi:TPA: hypothetical protein N0F65_011437 [Lagenidium giganteum]|uniref:Uncharacterized protein n=1 Tax=Lagenidium giganteum TaxID=4803 RepID=A0AAV2Z835_9STRA|nr:TPA: hypothetical protein N0F65_011437 [Lagenidium giganteum]
MRQSSTWPSCGAVWVFFTGKVSSTSLHQRRNLNRKAFGVEEPTDTDVLTHARSSTLKASKKMISTFMPRQTMPWDCVNNAGNPTKAKEVNAIIKRVQKFEVRRSAAVMRQLRAMHSTLLTMKRRLAEVAMHQQRELEELRLSVQRKITVVATGVKRIAAQPVVRPRSLVGACSTPVVANEDRVSAGTHQRAQLSKRPTDLFVLWHEYEFGCAGCKPAKQFTPSERGACKSVFSFRFGFWELIEKLMRRGHTSDFAMGVAARSPPSCSASAETKPLAVIEGCDRCCLNV